MFMFIYSSTCIGNSYYKVFYILLFHNAECLVNTVDNDLLHVLPVMIDACKVPLFQ